MIARAWAWCYHLPMRHLGIGLVIGFLASPALADDAAKKPSFDDISEGAVRIDRDGLAAILWAMHAKCDAGSDLDQRQCRAVRDARLATEAGKTFLVAGDASAFYVEAYDDKKKSAPLTVAGCIACVEPIVVDGERYYVLSNMMPPEWKGDVAIAAPIHSTAKTFKSGADAALNWRTEVVPRLKTEFVVKIPSSGATWKQKDGKQGLAVEVLGFRVNDPCDGHIICASPKADKVAPDKVACGETVAEGETDAPKEPANDGVPDELSSKQIKAAMAPTAGDAMACFEKYGVPGDAKLHITVGADGSVLAIDQSGDFEDTPTGKCIEDAVKKVTFPKSKKARQSFKYPFVLR